VAVVWHSRRTVDEEGLRRDLLVMSRPSRLRLSSKVERCRNDDD